jgi:hypothetical protein
MQRFITLAGLLVSLVSAEAASRPPKKSLLMLYGKRADLRLRVLPALSLHHLLYGPVPMSWERFRPMCQ